MSLYEDIGGEPAMMAAVTLFYDKVLADDRVKHFFEDLDMQAMTQKQVSFMSHALGGPEEYQGKPMGPAHAKLVQEKGLAAEHFDAIAELLSDTLVELNIAEGLRNQVLQRIGSLKDQVLEG